ncbi:hypothetical protein DW070_16915 [Coprococcus catus]|uniref:Uncharacterized protein n=1 Tax=Coprococcus catus TaxID=116085 RepID=A0A3E2TCE6_9FIRM|nr:hypothetical protein DW070_16915 [Coprococcus catus]
MSNFINDVINADAILDEIDDYIEKWHDSDTDCSVFEYLGSLRDGMIRKNYLNEQKLSADALDW